MSSPNKRLKKHCNGQRYCYACKCNSRKSRISFFRFPAEEPRCTQWFYNIAKAIGKPRLTKHNVDYSYLNLRLCANHFTNDMFSNKSKTRLHIDAIPTEFHKFEFVDVGSEGPTNGSIEQETIKTEPNFKIKEPSGMAEAFDFNIKNVIIKNEAPPIQTFNNVEVKKEASSIHTFNNTEVNRVSGLATNIKTEIIDTDSIVSTSVFGFNSKNIINEKEVPSSQIFKHTEVNNHSAGLTTKIKTEIVDTDSIVFENPLKDENIDIPFIKSEKMEFEDC